MSKVVGSSYINHFLQPDSLIPDPSNPQAWNRYSYTYNNPQRFNDPTGHDPIPWNPFAFNTLVISFSVGIGFLDGVDVGGDIVIDKKQFFSDDPVVAILLRGSFSGGIQGEVDGGATFYGTNDSVSEIVNNNVSSILEEGTLPVSVKGCWEVCVGGGYRVDPARPIWKGNESISYFLGAGYGGELSLKLAEVKDWIGYDPKGGKGRYQVPVRIGDYAKEAFQDVKKIHQNLIQNLKRGFDAE